ncbi:MAG: enoyl-CoA hydratase/isomerase family protein [Candidatus Zixiibacteriota bacterium]
MTTEFITTDKRREIVCLTLSRGKVNAINPELASELLAQLKALEADPSVKSVILSGEGKFFSFGFDLPEMMDWPREKFGPFIYQFSDLLTYMFLYPKPLIAAINGHATGGGCMLAIACDHRIMVGGKTKIALNEVNFGASVFAGSVEMLRFWTGSRDAWKVLSTGAMFVAEDAKAMGLVDSVVTDTDLMPVCQKLASELGANPLPAFRQMKYLLRKPIVEEYAKREWESIERWLDIWYSPETQALARSKVVIR